MIGRTWPTTKTHDVYLVVWQRHFSSTNTDVRGVRVDADGAVVGSVIGVRNSGVRSRSPRVANVATRDTFVVVWTEESVDIWADAVHAQTGASPSRPS